MRIAIATVVAAGLGWATLGAAAAPGGTAGTLRLHAAFHVGWKSVGCPTGTATTTSCYLNVGSVAIPALGKVREQYVLLVERSDTNCADWRFRIGLTVAGKGSITANAFRPGCFSPFSQSGTSRYRITGGSGAYRGAGGSGKIVSTGSETGPGRGIGVDTWTGTLTVPRRTLARTSGDLSLHSSFPVKDFTTTCPDGTPAGTECFKFDSTAPVPGLGVVTEHYLGFDDQSDMTCRHSSWSPVTMSVAGKGDIDAELAPATQCDGSGLFIGAASFTVTGGTGIYAGASGSGTENAGTFVSDVWIGTLTVPGLVFDTTAPAIDGAKARIVRVRNDVKRVRVRYKVTAADAVDGPVQVACFPRSGRLFKLGKTRVSCSATDSSANTSTAAFTVTVKRA